MHRFHEIFEKKKEKKENNFHTVPFQFLLRRLWSQSDIFIDFSMMQHLMTMIKDTVMADHA